MKLHTRALSVMALASLTVLSAQAPAATSDPTFSVVVNLIPSCVFTTADLTLPSYTSQQTSASTADAAVTAICTGNELYRLSLTGTNLTANGDNVTYDSAANATTGLTYTLQILSGTSGSTTVASTTSQTGTGLAQDFRVRGVIAADQVGTCVAADVFGNATQNEVCASSSESRNIVVTF